MNPEQVNILIEATGQLVITVTLGLVAIAALKKFFL